MGEHTKSKSSFSLLEPRESIHLGAYQTVELVRRISGRGRPEKQQE